MKGKGERLAALMNGNGERGNGKGGYAEQAGTAVGGLFCR